VESINAEIKRHRQSLRRGFTRVFGTTKNAILIALATAGVNISILRDWHAKRDLPEPSAIALGEPTALKSQLKPQTKTRARRRTLTNADAAPPGT
jgi:hypothetical protein